MSPWYMIDGTKIAFRNQQMNKQKKEEKKKKKTRVPKNQGQDKNLVRLLLM